MKIVIFKDNKEVIDVFDKIAHPKIFSTKEVMWENGGLGGIENNYVLLEDDQEFEDLSDEQILEQYKEQTIYHVARIFEDNRISYMVKGVLEKAQVDFEHDKMDIRSASDKEAVIIKFHEIANRQY